MTLDPGRRKKIATSFEDAKQRAEFASGERWLTYYLSGLPADLEAISEPLTSIQCSNLDGWEGGFLYAKQPCKEIGVDVASQVEEVLTICDGHSIEVLHVDLDTSPDVTRSQFKCLVEFDH